MFSTVDWVTADVTSPKKKADTKNIVPVILNDSAQMNTYLIRFYRSSRNNYTFHFLLAENLLYGRDFQLLPAVGLKRCFVSMRDESVFSILPLFCNIGYNAPF